MIQAPLPFNHRRFDAAWRAASCVLRAHIGAAIRYGTVVVEKPAILILGPTAGGKTHLAIELARRIPSGGECISCDSMQVYRGMDIGTAKPSAAERAAVPHHLLDIIEPSDDSFSVDRWLQLAQQAMAEIRTRNRSAIIVGGTNLYVQALLGGMMDGPEPDTALRENLISLDATALRAWLQRVDPVAAERIHPNDRKRSIRAIEVFELTGKRLSEQQTQWSAAAPDAARRIACPAPLSGDTIIIGLDFPVETINRRINARIKSMIERGLVDEVSRLYRSGSLSRNAREALGYKQIIEHLEGRCTLEEAIEQIKIRTRRFAKQQRTWLRRFRQCPNSTWIAAGELTPQELADKALAAILIHASTERRE